MGTREKSKQIMNNVKHKSIIEKITSSINPYVIAEIGINHNGDMIIARDMIDAACESGSDCVKFQSFIADEYISPLAGKATYQKQDAVAKESQKDIIKSCELTIDQLAELKKYATKKNVDFLSTPFEVISLRGLISLDLDAIKISSCNLTNYPFLNEAAQSGKPILLSTGMGDMAEVTKAVEIFKKSDSPLLLFQCTSNYPSKIENANLRTLNTYQQVYNVPVGFSDHTPTNTAAITAVALGAVAVEKHFTLSRDLPGIDQKASIEPNELKALVQLLGDCKRALGSPLKIKTDEEEDTCAALRRSLVAARDIAVGEILEENMIKIMRPGKGLSTEFIPQLIGRKLSKSVKQHELMKLDDFMVG